MHKSSPNFDIEESFQNSVIGIDEAGLGPFAGPLVLAGCCIPSLVLPDTLINNVNDSKKLSPLRRETIFKEVLKHPEIITAVSIQESWIIDSIGLAKAWRNGVKEVAEAMAFKSHTCIIDGNKNVSIPGFETHPIIKGDQKSFSISIASIIAKVTRDNIMKEIHKELEIYGFDTNVGYGTHKHIEAIKKFGISKYHRKSFKPIKRIIENGTLSF